MAGRHRHKGLVVYNQGNLRFTAHETKFRTSLHVNEVQSDLLIILHPLSRKNFGRIKKIPDTSLGERQ